MKWHQGFLIAILVAFLTTSTALKLELHNKSESYISPLLRSEMVVSSQPLQILNNSLEMKDVKQNQVTARQAYNEVEAINSTEHSSGQNETQEEIDHDNNFLTDKMPDLPEDEYKDIGEDGTPFNFLKHSELKQRVPAETPQPLAQPAGNNVTNAIYITVPIYINTASGGVPLSITVGGQNVPMTGTTNATVKSEPLKKATPTSKFNRLVNEAVAPAKQMLPLRTTNRHRSFIQSRNHARKQKQPKVKLHRVGSYYFFY